MRPLVGIMLKNTQKVLLLNGPKLLVAPKDNYKSYRGSVTGPAPATETISERVRVKTGKKIGTSVAEAVQDAVEAGKAHLTAEWDGACRPDP